VRQIIIDGYNVIRADTRLQSLERVSLQAARDVLVRTLASSPRLANDRILVVFDGRGGTRLHVHSLRVGRIDTMYSAQGQTADEVIVQQAGVLARTGRVVVVSNDVEVRERCRAEGCEVSASGNLLDQIPGRPRKGAPEKEDLDLPTLSSVKRGNPRRSPKRDRGKRDIRF
jgi:predicted RNA-binding protein with PIN domain